MTGRLLARQRRAGRRRPSEKAKLHRAMPLYFPPPFCAPQTNSRTRFVDQISYSILRRPCGEEVFSRSASAARSAPGAQLRVKLPAAITAKIEERRFFVGRTVRAPALARHGELGARAQLAFRISDEASFDPLRHPCRK